MTVDVDFGKYDNEEQIIKWPDKVLEKDGTSFEHTIYSGRPRRSFSNQGFYNFISEVENGNELLDLLKPKYPNTHDPEITLITEELMSVINNLKHDDPLHQDRIKFFQYWAKRTLQEFDSKAAIITH